MLIEMEAARERFDMRNEKSYREGLNLLQERENAEERVIEYLDRNLKDAERKLSQLEDLQVPPRMTAIRFWHSDATDFLEAEQEIIEVTKEEEVPEAYELALNAVELAEYLRTSMLASEEDLGLELDYHEIDRILGGAIEVADKLRDEYGEFIDENFLEKEYISETDFSGPTPKFPFAE
jgi:hypothetical protein